MDPDALFFINIYMKTKLCGHIAQIMYETAEVGICPNIRQVMCREDNLPFHVMTHPDKEKAVLIGLMEDIAGDVLVKTYVINYNKWNWASIEGFDLEGIFETELYKDVFKEVHPAQVSSYLLN
jgi:hypothetical protein